MKEHSRIRISQCMIVKNEERNIEQALSWGKGIVWEQIVVDTGSTDRTAEIAGQMGAKVFHFDWVDDFAAAKNYAIDQAQGDWIAFLDADECFAEGDAEKLLSYLEQYGDQYDSVISAWVHLDEEGKVLLLDTQMRVFRNLPALRYRRRIHEYLTMSDGSINRALNLVEELSILHTGYGQAEKKRKKASGRNLRLIREELREHPDDWEMWGYLGNEYDAEEERDQAEQAYRKAVSLMPAELEEYDARSTDIFVGLLQVLAYRPDMDERAVLEVYEQAVKCRPKEADFDYIVGRAYASAGNYQKGAEHLRRAFGILETYGYTARSKMLSGNIMKAYELLAICCYNNGELAECVQLTTALLKEDPHLMSTAVVLISAFRKDMEASGKGEQGALEVAAFLGKSFYDLQLLPERLFLMKAAMGAGYQDLVNVVRKLFTPEELAVVDQSLERQSERMRIVLFYSETESFNFFTNQLVKELEDRGHETFILDLRDPEKEGPHSFENFKKYMAGRVDAAICFDGFGTRDEELIEIWNARRVTVVDILMDPPFRFHPTLERHSEKYLLFCCDREHVRYVKKYFEKEVPNVRFMPHVGVAAGKRDRVIPYAERKYDILFSGTYYKPLDQLQGIRKYYPDNEDVYQFYKVMYENLKKNSDLTAEKAVLVTLEQIGWPASGETLKTLLNSSVFADWAIRMYVREQVVSVLAEAGFELHLLGRGWENHPSSELPNVHRIDDRIPYGETLAYMADAKINLNVMPWFKEGTHDRIFNTLLQYSVPLTDPSAWITDTFTDGVDIALYDLKHLELLPDIVNRLLTDTDFAERIIQNGYEKVRQNYTWSHCADWLLDAIKDA